MDMFDLCTDYSVLHKRSILAVHQGYWFHLITGWQVGVADLSLSSSEMQSSATLSSHGLVYYIQISKYKNKNLFWLIVIDYSSVRPVSTLREYVLVLCKSLTVVIDIQE